jgi:hypothetical protein
LAPVSLLGPTVGALTPPGPGVVTLGPPKRSVKASIGGALGIFPGQWWKALAPAAMEPQLSVADTENTIDRTKTQYDRVYRFDNRAVWAGGGKLELELYQLYQVSVTRANQDQGVHQNAEQTQSRNRITYRPIPTSSITLRLNYQDTRQINDPNMVGGSTSSWADQVLYEAILEWLRRWNRVITTRGRLTLDDTITSNYANRDPNSGLNFYNNTQYKAGPELELRFFPLQEAAALYLYQRDGVFRMFGHGEGAADGISYYIAVGGIWRVGDQIYLDWGVQYDSLTCLAHDCADGYYFKTACATVSRITPRLYLTVNL